DKRAGEIRLLRVSPNDEAVKNSVYQAGDKIEFSTAANDALTAIEGAGGVSLGRWPRALEMLAAALALFALALFLMSGHPTRVIVGQDNRYSNSYFQMSMWFATVVVAYVAMIALRGFYLGGAFIGGVGVPQNLLLLSGLSALTMVGAKGLTRAKAEAAAQAPLTPQKTRAAAPSFPSDLVTNDEGEPDMGDFQMIVMTILAAASYLLQAFHFLGRIDYLHGVQMPDLDTTILAVFGLGQGAYLGKKWAGTVGKS
ncbi:MAG: hypothetical protein ACREQD_03040, partial [Candidatus Binataceae bacterium]